MKVLHLALCPAPPLEAAASGMGAPPEQLLNDTIARSGVSPAKMDAKDPPLLHKTPEGAKAIGMEGIPFAPIYEIPVLWSAKSPAVQFSTRGRDDGRRGATEFMATAQDQWKRVEP